MRFRRVLLAGAAFVPLVAMAPAPAGPAPGGPHLPRPVPSAPRSYDVTLVTGDTVHVTVAGGRYRTSTELAPRPDGHPVLVSTLVGGGHTYVVPSDAAQLVASGRLDRRLFDVQQLIADGYADAATS